MMEYTTFGDTGLEVSRLCLGTYDFGHGPEWKINDRDQCLKIVDEAIKRGINFIDTANIYSDGESERIVGDAVAGRRDEMVIATKVSGRTRPGPNGAGLSRKHIFEAVKESLNRLQTDYIDLYYLHQWDQDTPIEETLEAMHHLIQDGKVRYFGMSNFPSWELMKAYNRGRERGFAVPECVEPQYSLVGRTEEENLLPVADHLDLGVATYAPLGGGLLTGVYDPNDDIPTTFRASKGGQWGRIFKRDQNLEVLNRVKNTANNKNVSPVAISVAWVLANETVDASIIGPNRVEHLDDYLDALSVSLTDQQQAHLEEPIDPVWHNWLTSA